MKSITFRLRPDLSPDQQDEAIERLRTLPGISQAHSLSPDSRNAELRRLCYAYVHDDAALHQVLKSVETQPDVEDASLPAPRGLPEHP